MHEMLGELEGTNEDLEQYDAFYNAIADMMASPVFRQVFGDDVVIALCQPNPEGLRDNPEQEFKNPFGLWNLIRSRTNQQACSLGDVEGCDECRSSWFGADPDQAG